MDFNERLIQLSEEMKLCSDEFKDSCLKYAYHFVRFQFLLGKRLASLTDKKSALDKIIVEYLSDAEFKEHYDGYIYHKSMKEGLNAQIESLKTNIMVIQSILKWHGKLDEYGNVV